MDRRTFLNWVGVGLLANSLPMALVACAKREVSTGEFHPIGTVTELAKNGQILNQQDAQSPILVVQDAANSNHVVAVNPTCTHRDCLVNWDKQQNVFLCDCHGSKFDAAGRVLRSPAEEPLSTYKVKIEGDRIFVSS